MAPEVYFSEAGPSSWYTLPLHWGPFRVAAVCPVRWSQIDVQKNAQKTFWKGGQGPAAHWTFAQRAA